MNILNVLGLDRYTERLKEWVKKNNETPFQRYTRYCETIGMYPIFTKEEAYDKYVAIRDNYASNYLELPGEYFYEEEVSWDDYGFTWEQFVALKERMFSDASCEPGDGVLYAYIPGEPDEDGYSDSFLLEINPNTETIINLGY